MKSLTKILLLTTLVVLPLLVPAPAQAARKMDVALQDDGFMFEEHPGVSREAGLSAARALGATHLRMNVYWWQATPPSQRNVTTVPSNIVYDFSRWDAAIARAAAWGIKTELSLLGDPPAWACGNKRIPYSCDGYTPSGTQWKTFVSRAVAHFRGRVSRFLLWNEPNWYTWLSPHKQSPLLYRKLVQTGYKAAKSANPSAQVVAGELAPLFFKNRGMPPLQFIREMVCVNRKLKRIRGANRKCGRKALKFDAWSHHPYELEHKPTFQRKNPDEVTMANVDDMLDLLARLRKKGLIKTPSKKFPVYLTEYGYMTTNPDVQRKWRIPEDRRAKWLVQGWKLAQGYPQVKQNLQYGLASPPAGSPSGYFDMGLLTSAGVPRKSYYSLGAWIKDAAASGKVAKPGFCSAC